MENEHFDPSQNILHRQNQELDAIFTPKNIAVIGATETPNSVGRTIIWNLLRNSFGGAVFPINPKRSSVMGIKAYPHIASVPVEVDLAIIVVPAKFVPEVIAECAKARVPSAVIISAGFKEMGDPGIELEKQILEKARNAKMRIIGPNCLGVMNPTIGMNATFAADIALPGNIGFISQSGALCTAVLDWSFKVKVGFSAFVSIGSMIDIGWGDLINYLGNDPNTKSILIYMESIGDPRAFLSAAREVALTKPIILIKAGRTEESAKAAASHTGSLSGSDAVLDAALRRVGVLRVKNIEDLFNMAEVIAKQPRPSGPNLTIITNAGGPGVIATDALIENQGKLTKLSEKTFDQLNEILPAPWSHNNPIDILGDASAELYAKTVEIVAKDSNSDGLLVILTPQDMTNPTEAAKKLIPHAKLNDKPILASWMGAPMIEKGKAILNKAGIPTFEYPDKACEAFAYMWKYSYNLIGIYETPTICEGMDTQSAMKSKQSVDAIIEKASKEGRTLLNEYESKKVLEAYQIPTVSTEIATSEEKAVTFADKMGYPIVLKLFSHTITHKTDVGGVKLNLANAQDVKSAYKEIYNSVKKLKGEEHFQGVTVQPMMKLDGYELILGSSVDPQFGPVLLFGMGGQLVEVFKDSALGLPPLNSTLARRMMEQTKIYTALHGVRGRKPIDLHQLEQILVRFSNLIADHPQINEFDINPLLASSEQFIALDARIILFKEDQPLPKLAIRPYPKQYVMDWKLKDNTEVIIRPIRPEDEPLMVQFHSTLSERTVRQRYLKALHYDELTTHERLIRICYNDYDREIALVVEPKGKNEILALVRLTKISGTEEARFAVIVRDSWQRKGIGRKLMQLLIHIAKNEGIKLLFAPMLNENKNMQSLAKQFGFTVSSQKESDIMMLKLKL